jgi:hypothetical protein
MRPWNSTPAGSPCPWARHGLLDTLHVISVANVKRDAVILGECVIRAMTSEIQLNQNIQCRFLEHFNLCDINCLEEYFDPIRKVSRNMEYALLKKGIHNFQFSTNIMLVINQRKVNVTEQVYEKNSYACTQCLKTVAWET